MLLHTEIYGDGEPILFLHTGLQTGLTDFEHQRDYFKQNYKVVLPDLRGHGKSIEHNFSNYFEESAMDLLETIHYYNLSNVHIVGCSLGALVALKFANKYPEKVKTLTISGIMPEKPDDWIKIHNEQVEKQTQILQNKQIVAHFDNIHASDWKQFIYMAHNEEWYPFEETKNVGNFNFPVLFMVGEGNKNEINGAMIYPRRNDKIHISIIPFASHLVHSEQPQIYTHVLEEFINQSK
ncbi:alpha/beta fold hydrolase [Chengkuizengella sediminis]|uniref:alpha/beta fold hydrolase n=1 Tax=Chengkuizengella sediminis TaxID=1885917 RepID=UPI001389B7C0|nr:alpha/beta hydrolase [Chengkuizengella sediminis]NDI33282.1 alpha/beta hydrolase [Chengkuizengella sediminis]